MRHTALIKSEPFRRRLPIWVFSGLLIIFALQSSFADDNSRFTNVEDQYSELAKLDDASFNEALPAISEYLRTNKDKALATHYLKAIPESFPISRKAQLEVKLYFDHMSLAHFEVAFEHLSQRIEQWAVWAPTLDSEKISKANLLHIYGQLLVRRDEINTALNYFKQAEALFKSVQNDHPSIWTIQVVVGEAYLKAGYYQHAAEFLEKASGLFPKNRLDARSYVAGLYAKALLESEGAAAALVICQNYLNNPVDPREDYFLYFSLIHLEVLFEHNTEQSHIKIAEETMALAKKIDNENYLKKAEYFLGASYYRQGNSTKAIPLLEASLEEVPDTQSSTALNAYLFLSKTYLESGQYKRAYTTLEKFLVFDQKRQEYLKNQSISEIATAYELERAESDAERSKLEALLTHERMVFQQKFGLVVSVLFTAALIVLAILIWAFRSIKRINKQLEIQSTVDPLTKASNRLAMMKHIETHTPKTVAILDLDYLKYYNDEYGHAKGDQLIQSLASHLKNREKESDIHFYRIGGDEFVVISEQRVEQALKQTLLNIEAELKAEGFSKAGLSFGICEHETQEFSTMLSKADTAMYKMKSAKRIKREG